MWIRVISPLWKILAAITAALGIAIVAHKYTEPPPEAVQTSAAPSSGVAAAARAAQGPTGGNELHPGWSKPQPDKLPLPTYWPMLVAFGLTFAMWGLISNLFILGFGIVVFIAASIGWIGDLLHDT